MLKKIRHYSIRSVLEVSIPRWIKSSSKKEGLAYLDLLAFVQTGKELKEESVKEILSAQTDGFGPKDKQLVNFIKQLIN